MATLSLDYASTTATTAITCGVASLASSATLVAGRASTVVDNTSNKYLDAQVSGNIRVGTSPTANKVIEVWAYGYSKVTGGTFSYHDGITGTDANKTMTSAAIKRQMRLIASLTVDATTSDRDYPFSPTSIAALFGSMPLKWGVFVVHNTGVNLNNTAGNHWIHYLGIKAASA